MDVVGHQLSMGFPTILLVMDWDVGDCLLDVVGMERVWELEGLVVVEEIVVDLGAMYGGILNTLITTVAVVVG